MGFLDKVKSMKNAITGGAAKVFVDADSPKIGEPFTVTVRAQSQGATVKYDKVYLYVRGYEEVEVPDTDVVYDSDGDSHRRTETVRATCVTFEHEMTVAPAGEIGADDTAEWTVEVNIPTSAPPPYRGRYTSHFYQVYAGLDCFGNDPDSGWIKLNLD